MPANTEQQKPRVSNRHTHAPRTGRPRCPVCDQDVFSPSGVHPQCEMRRNEAIAEGRPLPRPHRR
jgi:hypothetical protein